MLIFESILLVLVAAVLLTALARRLGAPYPAFLAMAGSLIAFVPGAPQITLDPGLAMALFIAPVLLDAAYDASPRDLRANWAPLAGLVLVAVGLTTAAVALVAKLLVPDMPWAVAIALGAVVAPPDAAAATAVLRQVRPPHRILTILEGESLLNDATALLIYRLAVGTAVAGVFSWSEVGPVFLLSVVGAVVLGPLLALGQMWLLRRFSDAPSSIVLQFAATFGVWLIAERLHVSPVLTVVAFGITAGRYAPWRTPARLRIPSYAVWETAVFVLNVIAFSLIGLQLRPIIERLEPDDLWRYGFVAVAVLIAVIAIRLLWTLSYGLIRAAKYHSAKKARVSMHGGVLIGWCGMRGILTLAAALALPETINGAPFPYRDLVLLTAFSVVVGTLVIQGLTLRPLLNRLALDDGDPVGQEVATARRHAFGAALAALDGEDGPEAEALREEYRAVLAAIDSQPAAVPTAPAGPLRRRAIDAARRAALALRASGSIGDDAFHRIEEDLDWAEMGSGGAV